MVGNITKRKKQTLCINIMCSLIKDQISTYEASWSKISNLNPIKLLDPPINLQEKIKDRNTLIYTMRMKSQKKKNNNTKVPTSPRNKLQKEKGESDGWRNL